MSEDRQRDLLPNEQDILKALGDRPYDIESMAAIANIYRAAAAIRRRAEAGVLADAGVSWGGFAALWVLFIWGQMETSRLAMECDLSKGTLTGILNTLESRNFISRERPPEDRRRMLVELTPAGTKVINELSPRFNEFESETASGLSPAEKQQLASLLRTIIGGLADKD